MANNPNKPTSILTLMKNKEQERLHVPKYPGITTSNRFLALAGKAGGGPGRDRNNSTKRSRMDSEGDKEEEDSAGGEDEVFASMEKTEVQLKEAKVIIDQVRKEIEKIQDSGPLWSAIKGMVKWMEVTTSIQEDLGSVMLDGFAKTEKKVRAVRNGAGPIPGGRRPPGGDSGDNGGRGRDTEGETDLRKKKFIHAVREAEKATLVFNTDMGGVPVMNTATMNRKFSMALKVMAATQDGNANGEPKVDTVMQLDDTLSMVKNMEYFGKTTKKGKGGYFTIPVKLTYKDRDTRMTAEANLRKLCKVSCSTPYHSTLRDTIKGVVEECKTRYKDSFIQARVDAENMKIKVSYRKYGEKSTWHNDVEEFDLPDSVYDTSNKVSRSRPSNENMEVVGGDQSQ